MPAPFGDHAEPERQILVGKRYGACFIFLSLTVILKNHLFTLPQLQRSFSPTKQWFLCEKITHSANYRAGRSHKTIIELRKTNRPKKSNPKFVINCINVLRHSLIFLSSNNKQLTTLILLHKSYQITHSFTDRKSNFKCPETIQLQINLKLLKQSFFLVCDKSLFEELIHSQHVKFKEVGKYVDLARLPFIYHIQMKEVHGIRDVRITIYYRI